MMHVLNECVLQEMEGDERYYIIPSVQNFPFPSNVDKLKLPSVTTLLSKVQDKRYLELWISKVGSDYAEQYTQRAAVRGTAVHTALESILAKKPVSPEHYQYWEFVEQAIPFISLVIPKLTEQKIYWFNEPSVGFAGTLDLLAELNLGHFRDSTTKVQFEPQSYHFLIDYKTWNKPKSQERLIPYYLQLSAYCGAVNFLTNRYYGVNRALLVGLTKNNYYLYYLSPEEMLFYWKSWMHILDHYFKGASFSWQGLLSSIESLGYYGTRVELIY